MWRVFEPFPLSDFLPMEFSQRISLDFWSSFRYIYSLATGPASPLICQHHSYHINTAHIDMDGIFSIIISARTKDGLTPTSLPPTKRHHQHISHTARGASSFNIPSWTYIIQQTRSRR